MMEANRCGLTKVHIIKATNDHVCLPTCEAQNSFPFWSLHKKDIEMWIRLYSMLDIKMDSSGEAHQPLTVDLRWGVLARDCWFHGCRVKRLWDTPSHCLWITLCSYTVWWMSVVSPWRGTFTKAFTTLYIYIFAVNISNLVIHEGEEELIRNRNDWFFA